MPCLDAGVAPVFSYRHVLSYICRTKETRMALPQIVSQPATLGFSAMLADIIISTEAGSGLFVLDLVIGTERANLLQETFYASSDGTITVGELPALVEPYIQAYGRVTMEASFTDTAGAASISPVTILVGAVDVGMTTQDFVSTHFLTVLDGEKITSLSREERLYAYDEDEATVSADVRLPDGSFDTLTAELQAVATEDDISQFDVSPRKILELLDTTGARLLYYTVTAGQRKQLFRCIVEQVPPEPSFLFVNSFGCEELVHCTGTLKQSSKFDRQSARIRGRLRAYQITEERLFTANTGWLNDAMAEWVTDLLRSMEVCLWSKEGRGKHVVITDSKNECESDDDYMPEYEITYTYAQRTQNIMHKRKAARLFSDQFEEIYN